MFILVRVISAPIVHLRHNCSIRCKHSCILLIPHPSDNGFLFFLLCEEELSVQQQMHRNLILRKKCAEDALFLKSCLAFPVSLKKLFYVFVVHCHVVGGVWGLFFHGLMPVTQGLLVFVWCFHFPPLYLETGERGEKLQGNQLKGVNFALINCLARKRFTFTWSSVMDSISAISL